MIKKLLLSILTIALVFTTTSFAATYNKSTIPISGYDLISSVAINPRDSSIYVLARHSSVSEDGVYILKYDKSGTPLGLFPAPPEEVSSGGLAIDLNGNVFNLSLIEGTIKKFAPDGRLLMSIGAVTSAGSEQVLANPRAMAIWGANLYVLDQHVDTSNHIKRYYTSSGRFVSSTLVGGFSGAINNMGAGYSGIYVTVANGDRDEYQALRFPLSSATSPISSITLRTSHCQIAVDSVNESGVYIGTGRQLGKYTNDLSRNTLVIGDQGGYALAVSPTGNIVATITRNTLEIYTRSY